MNKIYTFNTHDELERWSVWLVIAIHKEEALELLKNNYYPHLSLIDLKKRIKDYKIIDISVKGVIELDNYSLL